MQKENRWKRLDVQGIWLLIVFLAFVVATALPRQAVALCAGWWAVSVRRTIPVLPDRPQAGGYSACYEIFIFRRLGQVAFFAHVILPDEDADLDSDAIAAISGNRFLQR